MSNQQPVPSMRSFWLGSWKGRILIALFIIGILAALLVSLRTFGRMMMGTPPSTAEQYRAAAPGQTVEIMMEINSITSPDTFAGNLIEAQGSNYHRTDQTVNIQLEPDASVVMGAKTDLQTGAIVQVRGVKQDGDLIKVQRIVILTNYVEIR